MSIVPRSELWPGQAVLTSGGNPRPRLPKGIGLFAVHYTGVSRQYMREADVTRGMLGIQEYAAGAGKPWEYNYMIGHDGRIQEYAGVYQAAHSRGNNGSSYGCLLLLGIGEVPPDAVIDAIADLRRELVANGDLAADHEVRPHHHMPGASTSCPGAAILSRWHEIDVPLAPKPQPAPTPSPEDPPVDKDSRIITLSHEKASFVTHHGRKAPIKDAGMWERTRDLIKMAGGNPEPMKLNWNKASDVDLFRAFGPVDHPGWRPGRGPRGRKLLGKKRDAWGVPFK